MTAELLLTAGQALADKLAAGGSMAAWHDASYRAELAGTASQVRVIARRPRPDRLGQEYALEVITLANLVQIAVDAWEADDLGRFKRALKRAISHRGRLNRLEAELAACVSKTP